MHKLAVLKKNEKQKRNFYTKGWLFPSLPPIPWKFLCFPPHLVSDPGKFYYNSRQYLFLQMLSKWREGQCHFTSTDFQKETLLPWSTRALALKSRCWALKEMVCIYFIWLSTKRGCLGLKKSVFTKTSPNYTIFSASFNKAKGPFRGRACRHLGGRSSVTDTGGS